MRASAAGRVDVGQQLLQAGRRRGQAGRVARQDVDADADDGDNGARPRWRSRSGCRPACARRARGRWAISGPGPGAGCAPRHAPPPATGRTSRAAPAPGRAKRSATPAALRGRRRGGLPAQRPAVPGAAQPAAAGGLALGHQQRRRPVARRARGASVRCWWNRCSPATSTRQPGTMVRSAAFERRDRPGCRGSGAAVAPARALGHRRRQPWTPQPALSGRRRLGASKVPRHVAGAAPARVFGLELLRVALVDDQAVVVVEFFAGRDIAQRLDEDPAVLLVGLAVRVARVVDPARGVAAVQGIDDTLFVDVEIEGVVRILRIVRMAALRLFPAMISPTYSMMVSPSAISCTAKTPFTVHAGAAGLDAARAGQKASFLDTSKNLVM